MKLYTVARSPFGARVQAAAALKGLRLEIAPPPQSGLKSPDYLNLNPMGRLPTLVLADGRPLPESEVIVEYLEQVYPQPALLPAEPWARARARLVARVAELYVMTPLFALFRHLGNPHDPLVVELFATVQTGLEQLEMILGDEGFAWGDEPTLADCALAPFLFWVRELAKMFGRPAPFVGTPKLMAYDRAIRGHPVIGPVLTAMADDLAALRSAR